MREYAIGVQNGNSQVHPDRWGDEGFKEEVRD